MTESESKADERAALIFLPVCNNLPRSSPRSQHHSAADDDGRISPEPNCVGKTLSPEISPPRTRTKDCPNPTTIDSPSASSINDVIARRGLAPALSEKFK